MRSCAFKSACQPVSASRRSVMPRHSCDRIYFLARSLTTHTRRLTAWSAAVCAQTKILQGVCSELPVQGDLGPPRWEHHHCRQTLTVCRCHTPFCTNRQLVMPVQYCRPQGSGSGSGSGSGQRQDALHKTTDSYAAAASADCCRQQKEWFLCSR